MKYQRSLLKPIVEKIETDSRVIVLFGPRRVGKTTLLSDIQTHFTPSKKIRFVSGDEMGVQDGLKNHSAVDLLHFIGQDTELLIIDEAQMIPGIGLTLKILYDQYCVNGHLRILVSGSSSFHLAGQIREPLVGRAWTYFLGPISVKEYLGEETWKLSSIRGKLLTYGQYPEVLNATGSERITILEEIVSGYVFKDILSFEGYKNAPFVRKLLTLLAFQVGQLVSINELSIKLERSKTIVEKYLWLLQESFIIFPISSYARNRRNEISKKMKYYFWDVGIRNALASSFGEVDMRPDKGLLWENLLISERIRFEPLNALGILSRGYYWRTYGGYEVDWVEERDGGLFAYEIKWGEDTNTHNLSLFQKEYKSNVHTHIVNISNSVDFIEKKI